MNTKGNASAADYLDFDKVLNKSLKMLKEGEQHKIAFLMLLGVNSGLRIGDLSKIKYEDLEGDFIFLTEEKTKKTRKIKINDNIREGIKLLKKCSKISDGYIFLSNQNTIISTQYVNRKLKEILKERGKSVSSHSLRKTFGRRVWENNEESDKALILLSDIFNHSSTAITRRYLGIRQEEISEIYMNL